MKNRLIAACVLAWLTVWSVPAAVASWHQAVSSTVQGPARQAASSGPHHWCCPHVHLRFLPPLLQMPVTATMPCGDKHSCCRKQLSGNQAFLAAAAGTARPGPQGLLVTVADRCSEGRIRSAAQASGSNPSEPDSEHGSSHLSPRAIPQKSRHSHLVGVCRLSDRA
jgi:hypothetical protein